MKSIRKFAYAALLMLSALNFAPQQASAQEVDGTFTLTHEVRWQNARVPAGKYYFTMGSAGPAELLTLRKVNGTAAGFMFMVNDTSESQPRDVSRLVIVSRSSGGSFVSTMQLPAFGVTLHFAVPAEPTEGAQAVATTTASAASR